MEDRAEGEQIVAHLRSAMQRDPEQFVLYRSGHRCFCSGSICKCCVNLGVGFLGLNDTVCVTVKHMYPDALARIGITWNGVFLISKDVTVEDIVPDICIKLPIPIIGKALASLCIDFHDISVKAHELNICMSIKAILAWMDLFNFQVGCLDIGPPKTRSAWSCRYHYNSDNPSFNVPKCRSTCKGSRTRRSMSERNIVRELRVGSGSSMRNSCVYSKRACPGYGKYQREQLIGCIPRGYLN